MFNESPEASDFSVGLGLCKLVVDGDCESLFKLVEDGFLFKVVEEAFREARGMLVDEVEREDESLNRDRRASGMGATPGSGRSGKLYKPVSGSAPGCAATAVCRAKFAVPTKSFPESLSLSMTVKLSE